MHCYNKKSFVSDFPIWKTVIFTRIFFHVTHHDNKEKKNIKYERKRQSYKNEYTTWACTMYIVIYNMHYRNK